MLYKHLKQVLTAEQCQAIIQRGHDQGFEQALVNMGDGTQKLLTHVRNNERVLFSDVALAQELQERLFEQHAVPLIFEDHKYVKTGAFFRLYKYVPGQFFKPHRDGSFEDVDGSESEITVLFYLNDTDGGETILMPHGKQQDWSHIRIAPKAGDVLMFEHNVLHSGEPVHSGEKYVLRTDLFYA